MRGNVLFGLDKTARINVLALTKYSRLAASSRHRFFNYVPLLAERGLRVTAVPLLSDVYVKRRFAGERIDYLDVARSFASRLAAIAGAWRFDVLWIEGELFPRVPAIVERFLAFLRHPFVVDLDDAIFHTYDENPSLLIRSLISRKIDVVLNRATVVTVGNDYLADRARHAGARRVEVVPTTVDDRAYAKVERKADNRLAFGWIGSPGTELYLQTITPQLKELCSSLPATLRLIGIEQPQCDYPNVVLRPWNDLSEIDELAACDIGLAPLFDGPWERGKCGLKAIQYMAAGLPVLAANVGALPSIVLHEETGFVYRDSAEFTAFARQLAASGELRRRMGMAGKQRVTLSYSIHHWVETVENILLEAASLRKRSTL